MIKEATISESISPSQTAYIDLMHELGLEFTISNFWIFHGTFSYDKTWLLFVSYRVSDGIKILKPLLLALKKRKCSFRLTQSPQTNYGVNCGDFGINELGKSLTIFTKSDEEAVEIYQQLKPITDVVDGPQILGCLKLSKNIYALRSEIHNFNQIGSISTAMSMQIPKDKSLIPFKINKKSYNYWKPKKIIGRCYIPIKIISQHGKGTTYKAISLKHLSFKPVIVKHGKMYEGEDHWGRDIRDRLSWEHQLSIEIQDHIPTAKVIEYRTNRTESWLVLEFVEGKTISSIIDELINQNLSWATLNKKSKIWLLSIYLKILDIIQNLHNRRIVHRDISDRNFLITPTDQVIILDFELAHALVAKKPMPPFQLGTAGYVSPEQLNFEIPNDISPDLYSPAKLLKANLPEVKEEIIRKSLDRDLSEIICSTLDTPKKRPPLQLIKNTIEQKIKSYEI